MDDVELNELLSKAKALPPMTPEEKFEQMISFAYGNGNIDNPNITKEMVRAQAEKLRAEGKLVSLHD